MPPSRQGNVNTESVDNYLKAILALSGPDERRVSSTSLADRLGCCAGFGHQYAAKAGGSFSAVCGIRETPRSSPLGSRQTAGS